MHNAIKCRIHTKGSCFSKGANTKCKWPDRHQQAFENLLSKFKQKTLKAYYDMNKQTYLFTDAHVTGFGPILAQGESMEKVTRSSSIKDHL